MGNEEFIKRARAKHGDRYDYSLVDYQCTETEVIIRCREHGEFRQKAGSHLQGKGCFDCGRKATNAALIRLDNKEFIKRARAKHGDRYDYGVVDYQGWETKVAIICREHGEFRQIVGSHLGGRGCPACGIKSRGELNTLSNEEFIQRARTVHGNRYDYSLVVYLGAYDKIIIICPEHGEFKQAPHVHDNGRGCPGCATPGLNPFAPAILYYVRINDGGAPLYKIGITNRTVAERFAGADFAKMTVLKEWEYASGYDAREQEQFIINECSDHLYDGPDVLNLKGNTELFDTDILGLDIVGIAKG